MPPRRFMLRCALLMVGGCAMATPPRVAPSTTAGAPAQQSAALRVLRVLAGADARFALRAGIETSEAELQRRAMTDILAEDTTARTQAGRADLFSFDARERALAEAQKISAEYTQSVGSGSPEGLRLAALVSEERARLGFERQLPSGAPSLLRGLAAAWEQSDSPAASESADARISERLVAVDDSLVPLSAELRDAIEAALDPLESKLPLSHGRSQRALVRLRVRLSEMPPVQGVEAGPREPEPAENSLEPLRLLLASRALSAAASRGAPSPGPAGACRLAATGSIVGGLTPPPERQTLCVLVKALGVGGPSAELLASAHDRLVVARWASRIASGTPAVAAIQRPRPLELLSPGRERELTREAALQPNEVASEAKAIAWLFSSGVEAASARARAWEALGDAPVDLAIALLDEASP